MEPVLEVKNLSVEFDTDLGTVRAVNSVSFAIGHGETIGLVGESGCGKTVTSLSLLGLVPSPPGRVVSGSIKLKGTEIVGLDESQLREIRGRDISMIFQEPMTALNPVFRIGNQMIDVLRQHKNLSVADARAKAIEMLSHVRIPLPERRMEYYPHELSGGMRQRVMIAMALSCSPSLLVADEPTTALDVTTQAQVLEEMNRLQSEFQMALMLVTHDLGVVAEMCRRVIVMYCGEIIEMAPVKELFSHPKHPYTKGLLASIPRVRAEKLKTLPTIEGMVPDLRALPKGCLFAERCPKVQPECLESRPPLEAKGEGRLAACFFPEEPS